MVGGISGVTQNAFVFGNPNMRENKTIGVKADPLDKQISFLQEQMKKLNEDKSIDSETKQNKLKDLEEQVRALEEQKRKQQLEEMKKKTEESKQTKPADTSEKGVGYNLTKALVSGSDAVQSIKKTNALRVEIIGEIRIAEGEDGVKSAYSEKQKSRLQEALVRTADSLYNQIGEADADTKKHGDEIAKAVETERKEAEQEEAKKNNGITENKTDAGAEKTSTDNGFNGSVIVTEESAPSPANETAASSVLQHEYRAAAEINITNRLTQHYKNASPVTESKVNKVL